MTFSRAFRDIRYRIFYGLLLDGKFPVETLGSTVNECAWNVHTAVLGPDSIVYSGGVGRDITFEHELVRRFGCKVVLADPSPTGCETMALPENRIPEFVFCPVALAGRSGDLTLAKPINAQEGSWYLHSSVSDSISVPCIDLSSLMEQNGHSYIDLLKLDIEGAELEVIEDLLSKRIPIRQICVEYHHGLLPGIRRSETVRSILKLRMRGYRLLDQVGNNHTFLWSGPWSPRS